MAEEVISGVYDLPMSIVHSYIVVADEVILIDSGYPGWSERILQEIARHNQQIAHVGHIIIILRAATVDHELSDGEQLPIGEGLKIVHTPGHKRA